MAHATLSGSWSGAYRYPGDAVPETVFNVQIEEVGGGFTGAMQEPSLLRPNLEPVASAEIEGVRSGGEVSFAKFYDGSGGMAHVVHYQGTADAALTRIDGRWNIPGDWSGTFFMTRDDAGAEAQAEERAKETIGVQSP